MTHALGDLRVALRTLRKQDPGLSPWIKAHGAPSFARTRNSFESLGRAIIYQQLSGKAAGTIYRRFREQYGGRFPKPEVLALARAAELRKAGVSKQKAGYLVSLAEHYLEGTVTPRRFSRMDNAEISEQLTQVKGIGQWSADMFLMFGLNRPDVLPVGDLGVQYGMKKYFGLRSRKVDPKRLVALSEPWRPFRTVASWYMWRVHEAP